MRKTLEELERELAGLTVTDRWGETRRFHSNRRKIERRNKLITRISEMRVKAGIQVSRT